MLVGDWGHVEIWGLDGSSLVAVSVGKDAWVGGKSRVLSLMSTCHPTPSPTLLLKCNSTPYPPPLPLPTPIPIHPTTYIFHSPNLLPNPTQISPTPTSTLLTPHHQQITLHICTHKHTLPHSPIPILDFPHPYPMKPSPTAPAYSPLISTFPTFNPHSDNPNPPHTPPFHCTPIPTLPLTPSPPAKLQTLCILPLHLYPIMNTSYAPPSSYPFPSHPIFNTTPCTTAHPSTTLLPVLHHFPNHSTLLLPP